MLLTPTLSIKNYLAHWLIDKINNYSINFID